MLHAGQDLSHWFDRTTLGLKTRYDESRSLTLPYLPMGRFVHVPPAEPTSTWSTQLPGGGPWWQDEQYVIGQLSRQVRKQSKPRVLRFFRAAEISAPAALCASARFSEKSLALLLLLLLLLLLFFFCVAPHMLLDSPWFSVTARARAGCEWSTC